MATETIKVQRIEVAVDTSSEALFGGWSSIELETVDAAASVGKYIAVVADEIHRYWPGIEVEVEDAGVQLRDVIHVYTTGSDIEAMTLEEETAEAIRSLMSEIYNDGNRWQVEGGKNA